MRTLLTSLCFILMFSTVGNAKLVFDSVYYGTFIMDDDGSNFTKLPEESKNPNWSPDGKQIVFKARDLGISMMNADGTNIRQLTNPKPETDHYPSFLPDGKKVLFLRYGWKTDNRWSINILNLENGEIMKIFSKQYLGYPRLSPDGKQIVFSSSDNNKPGINLWIMDVDGNNARQLIHTTVGDRKIQQSMPKWSSDSQQILYKQFEYTKQQRGKVVVWIHKAHRYMICDRNGENIQELNIPKNLESAGLDWMDEDKSVVFSANVIELDKLFGLVLDYKIYKYHIATEKMTQIGDDDVFGYSVDWVSDNALSVSPKGKKQTQWGELKKDTSHLK